MTKIKNLLPIGSVVHVKNATKQFVIIGILMDNNGQKFDYCTVLYPEGYMDQQHMYLINHEDVEKVEFIGYINSEFQLFRGTLADTIEGR